MGGKLCDCGARKDAKSALCRACRLALRRQAATRPCLDCGTPIANLHQRCRRCWSVAGRKSRRDDFEASRSRGLGAMNTAGPRTDMLGPATRANRQAGNPYGVGAARCGRCKRPIIISGLCFTCSTGRARTIFRADERAATGAEAAA